MQSWQYWMSQGNSAYQQQQLSHAVYCYRQALADVWPVWYHCAFVCCPAELDTEEASLPTHCFAVVLLNLAETYAKASQWQLCQRTLAQGLFWFRRMLQQSTNLEKITVAVLQQQAALNAARAQYQRKQHGQWSVTTTKQSNTKPMLEVNNAYQQQQTGVTNGMAAAELCRQAPAKDERFAYTSKNHEKNNDATHANRVLH